MRFDPLSGDNGVSERVARYDAWFTTPLGRAMDAAETRAVLALAAPRPGEHALDAGCGTGIYTRRLADLGATVTGVDADPEMLAAARLKVPSAMLIQADVTALPFADATFDLTLAVTLLCFVDEPQRAVRELVRVTRPGGPCSPRRAQPLEPLGRLAASESVARIGHLEGCPLLRPPRARRPASAWGRRPRAGHGGGLSAARGTRLAAIPRSLLRAPRAATSQHRCRLQRGARRRG